MPRRARGSQGVEPRRDDRPAGGGRLVQLDRIDGVGQRRGAKRDDLDVEARPQAGQLPVRPFAVEDHVRGTVRGARPPSKPPTISKRQSGRSAARRSKSSVSNHSSTAPTYPTVSGVAPRGRIRHRGEERGVAGVGRGSAPRGSRPRVARGAPRTSRRRGRPASRGPAPASSSRPGRFFEKPAWASRQSYTIFQPKASASRRASGAQNGDSTTTAVSKSPYAVARPRERGERVLEGAPLEAPVGRILAAHARDRQEENAGRDAGRRRGLARSRERAVEDAAPPPGERLRELLRSLPAIGPRDDGKKENVGPAGRGVGRIEDEPRDLDLGLSDAEQPLGCEAPPQRPAPGERHEPASEGVEPPARALFPLRSHGAQDGSPTASRGSRRKRRVRAAGERVGDAVGGEAVAVRDCRPATSGAGRPDRRSAATPRRRCVPRRSRRAARRPASTASGRSVFSRRTSTGFPKVGASSWIPPESVRTIRQRRSRRTSPR